MQTLKAFEYNTQYPNSKFSQSAGYVTFDEKLKIATWAKTKKLSVADFIVLETKAKERAEKIKATQKRSAEAKRLADIAKSKADYEAALNTAPVITLTPIDDRYNVEYKVGDEKRVRNLSVNMINSLLDTTQKKLFTNGKRKKFTIDKYDFRSVIVNGARRPGVSN